MIEGEQMCTGCLFSLFIAEEVNDVGQSTKSTRNQSVVSFDMSSWKVSFTCPFIIPC